MANDQSRFYRATYTYVSALHPELCVDLQIEARCQGIDEINAIMRDLIYSELEREYVLKLILRSFPMGTTIGNAVGTPRQMKSAAKFARAHSLEDRIGEAISMYDNGLRPEYTPADRMCLTIIKNRHDGMDYDIQVKVISNDA